MTVPTIKVEVQLLDWSNSRRGGPKLVVQLPDEDALVPFKALTFAQGKIAGQRLMAVFVIIGDDEQPQPVPGVHEPDKPKGMAIASLAGQWCNDPDFQAWLSVKYAELWLESGGDHDTMDPDEIAANTVRELCGVASRAELDHSPLAKAQWEKYIRGPWRVELQRRETHDPGAQQRSNGEGREHGRDVQADRGKTT